MKGVVFTEFMELVESRMGLDMLDRIVTEAELPNGGAYTSVGTCDHAELVRLVGGCVAHFNESIPVTRTGLPMEDKLHRTRFHLAAAAA